MSAKYRFDSCSRVKLKTKMIKIKIDAASGAEARAELLNLLGLFEDTQPVIKQEFIYSYEKKDEPGENTEIVVTEKQPDVEEPKKKRRTKAEMEADALKANTGTEEPPASEENVSDGGGVQMEQVVEVPTLQDLQRICAILVRAGYREKGTEFIKTVGGADKSPDVPEGKRAEVIAAMTAFAEENKIAL